MCVCVCVCARARARACVRVCICNLYSASAFVRVRACVMCMYMCKCACEMWQCVAREGHAANVGGGGGGGGGLCYCIMSTMYKAIYISRGVYIHFGGINKSINRNGWSGVEDKVHATAKGRKDMGLLVLSVSM